MSVRPHIYEVGTLTYTKPALATLFFWLLWGDFCYMLMESVVPSIMPLKLQSLGASNTTIGMLLTTIPRSINIALNPIVSIRSDRFRSKWGRRIPFIFFTLPPLVFCLVGLGVGERIGSWMHEHFALLLGRWSVGTVTIATMGFLLVLFSFFNLFVNAIFWYLFNDVVPEQLLTRFTSWIRIVSMASVAVYNLFIFKYAGAHATAIMIGAAGFYAVGFGLMCLKVREGEYPPPPKYGDQEPGVLAAVRTYGRECHGDKIYWYVFLIAIGLGGALASTTFMLFFYQSAGLTLARIGTVVGVGNIATGIFIVGSGWLADRFHPIRVVIVGLIAQVTLATPVTLIWLFYRPSADTSYYLWLTLTVVLIAPAAALWGVLDPPVFMRIFPRERYGQFCSANALWRSGAMLASGLLVGACLDAMKSRFGVASAYFTLPLWQLACYGWMLFFAIKLYRSWLAHGGDEGYRPPLPAVAHAARILWPEIAHAES